MCCHTEHAGRTVKAKGGRGEVLESSKECVTGHCRNLYYKVAGNLAELCCAVA